MKRVKVKIHKSDSPVISYQCGNCGYFDFEDKSMKKAINEIKAKEQSLNIKQKIVKLSHNRLGMYFNKDVIRCLNLNSGNEIRVSVPDKNHIVLNLKK